MLSSPTGLLVEPIRFHSGLNLILGRYSENRTEHGINGIGKSSFVRLVDYLLISDSAERRFSGSKYDFLRKEQHQVCLDLEVSGEEIRIRRDFRDTKNIFIQRNRNGEKEFSYNKDEAKDILGNLFFPPDNMRQLPGERYRSLMQFFIKDDLNHQQRISPINFLTYKGTNNQELFTLNLFLLGLPNKSLINFGKKQILFQNIRKKRDIVLDGVKNSTGKSLVTLKTDLAMREKELDVFQKSLKRFELIEDFKLVSEAIADVANKISEHRKMLEQTDHQISKFHKFTTSNHEVVVSDIVEQYNLVKSSLGELVQRNLNDVIAFRESLAQARSVFYGNRMRELEDLRKNTFETLIKFEKNRAFLLRQIEEKNTNISLGEAFERFASKQVEYERIKRAVSDVAIIDQELSELEVEIGEARRDMVHSLNTVAKTIQSIQELFVEIIEKAIGLTTQGEREGAYLDISPISSRRRNSIPVSIDVEIPRSDALSHARLRLVVYDLTVFFHAIDSKISLPRFLIHDGVFHAVSRRTVVRTLNYIFQKGQANPSFQYIVSFNEDELSSTGYEEKRDGRLEFKTDQVTILKLGDHPNEMLFKRRFN